MMSAGHNGWPGMYAQTTSPRLGAATGSASGAFALAADDGGPLSCGRPNAGPTSSGEENEEEEE